MPFLFLRREKSQGAKSEKGGWGWHNVILARKHSSFWFWVKKWGTNFAATHLNVQIFNKILWHDSWEISTALAVSYIFWQWSSWIGFLQFFQCWGLFLTLMDNQIGHHPWLVFILLWIILDLCSSCFESRKPFQMWCPTHCFIAECLLKHFVSFTCCSFF